MMMLPARRRLIGIALAATLFSLAACSSETAVTTPSVSDKPTGGWLTLQLTTPNTNDGAVQLSVTGPAIDSVALVGYDGFDTNDGMQADLVATGSIVSGDLARIYVPDLTKTGAYQVVVTAAAARDSYALQTLGGYRVVVVR
jgi:hypothetical protein